MVTEPAGKVSRRANEESRLQGTGVATDAGLLERFAAGHDPAAFAELVNRHGPMVLRVCRRVLGNSHDADDAFQATFVILVKKAASVAQRERLANWLYGVAYRVALQVREDVSRRRSRERPADSSAVPDNHREPDTGWRELRPVLDAELQRLPEKYRVPVVLCYLEGKTNEQAAQELAWPAGTVKVRLSRARELLRDRLARRGVALTVGGLALLLTRETAPAAVPAALAQATQAAALTGASVAAPVVAVANAALKSMAVAKIKIAAGILAAVSVAGAALGTTVYLSRVEAPARAVWLNFDGPTPPLTQSGDGFPNYYYKPEENEAGGIFATSINTTDAVAGSSLQMELTKGRIKARFLPIEKDGVMRFARDYAAAPKDWRFNTYNRFRFWLKSPPTARSHRVDGDANVFLLTSMQSVKSPGQPDDEPWFHHFNVPATGHWTQVIVNMHPHNRAGKDQGRELGRQPHPTGEADYNFFDTLTSLYLECRYPPSRYPAAYLLDEMEFYREPAAENDEQIYGLTATHVAAANRIIVTWNRHKDEDRVRHEVRYAFRPVHEIGWQQAMAAPGGLITPLGAGAANAMVYDSTALPLSGRSMLYVAIKPENSARFSQVALPLTLR
jgi:RNA polymerase sigma factor (sigma-70 family)